MMGSNDKPPGELFYAFNLDDIVPQDHLPRDVDRAPKATVKYHPSCS